MSTRAHALTVGLGALLTAVGACGDPLTPAGFRGDPALVVRGDVHALQPSRWGGDFDLDVVWVGLADGAEPTLAAQTPPEGALAQAFTFSLYDADRPPLLNTLATPPAGWVEAWSCSRAATDTQAAAYAECRYEGERWRCRIESAEGTCRATVDDAEASLEAGCTALPEGVTPWGALGGPTAWRQAFEDLDPHCAASARSCSADQDGFVCEATMSAGAVQGALGLGLIAVVERDAGDEVDLRDAVRGRAAGHVVLYADNAAALGPRLERVVLNPDQLRDGYNLAVAHCGADGRWELLVVGSERVALVALDLLDERCLGAL